MNNMYEKWANSATINLKIRITSVGIHESDGECLNLYINNINIGTSGIPRYGILNKEICDIKYKDAFQHSKESIIKDCEDPTLKELIRLIQPDDIVSSYNDNSQYRTINESILINEKEGINAFINGKYYNFSYNYNDKWIIYEIIKQ